METFAVAKLTRRFEEALSYAARLHARQKRKRTEIPYVAHLLSVCALVLEDGGSEEEAIAALLHDAVEDQGGPDRLDEIRERFGERIADIVAFSTDAETAPKPPWRERKEAHIARLRAAPPEVARVVLADKLHNARSILADHRRIGDAVFDRFKASKAETLWFYRSMGEALRAAHPGSLADELGRAVAALEASEAGR